MMSGDFSSVPAMGSSKSPGFSVPWLGGARCSGLRVVLPTAPKERQPWGPLETTWHEWLGMVNWIFNGPFFGTCPLVNQQKTLERSTIFNG